MKTPPDNLDDILSAFKTALGNGQYELVPRQVNRKTLSMLGILPEDLKDELQDLCASDYNSGPKTDRDRPNAEPLWVFKKIIQGKLIYIKFKIIYNNDLSVKFISFHIDGDNNDK